MRFIRLFLFALGTAGLYLCYWAAQWDVERLGWPEIKARVIEVDTRPAGDEGTTLEIPFARFEYVVSGTSYVQKCNVGRATNARSSLDQALRDFAVGKEVMARYNPQNPQDLRPVARITGVALAGIVLGVVVAAATVVIGVGMFLSQPTRRTSLFK